MPVMTMVDTTTPSRPGSPVAAQAGNVTERLALLERRIDVLVELGNETIDRRAACCIRSIGSVVDYLASRGLIDRDDLARCMERDLPVTDLDGHGEPSIPNIDMIGWLRRTAAIRDLSDRTPPHRPGIGAPSPSSMRDGPDHPGPVEPHVEFRAPGDAYPEPEPGE